MHGDRLRARAPRSPGYGPTRAARSTAATSCTLASRALGAARGRRARRWPRDVSRSRAGRRSTHDPELDGLARRVSAIPGRCRTALADRCPTGTASPAPPAPTPAAAAGTPPRRLADLVADLARRNDDPHHGAIDVRILTLPDGTRRAIVDITGTKSWTPRPTGDVTSLTTNGRALVGEPTAYEGGVLAAMRRAGVRRHDDVMLVGHSQGGLVAVNTARHAAPRRVPDHPRRHRRLAGRPHRRLGAAPVRRAGAGEHPRRRPAPRRRANPDRRNVTTATVDAATARSSATTA